MTSISPPELSQTSTATRCLTRNLPLAGLTRRVEMAERRCGRVCGDILKDSKRTASTTPSV